METALSRVPRFSVEHRGGEFRLREACELSAAEREYLELYLRRVSRYRPIGQFRGSPVLSLYQPPLATAPGTRSLALRLSRRFSGRRIPATATLAVNRACQCECEHCSAVFYNHGGSAELSGETWHEAIRQGLDLGVTEVIFLGGEPLLRRDLVELVRAVDSQRAVATLFTNGEFLSPERCAALAGAGLLGAFVSLDSPEPEEHDRLRRRPGLYDKALAGIAHLQRAGALTAISTYLSPERLARGAFEAMMELGRELGVNEVTFFDAIPSGRWLGCEAQLLRPPDRDKISRLVREYRGKPAYPGISAQSLLTSEGGSAYCFAGNTQFYLNSHGEMCPCDFTPLTIGRFPEESLSALWERLTRTPPYDRRAKSCRMQDPEFRRAYIEPIVSADKFPVALGLGKKAPD
ncbi:MAG: radical SAM protein [bacterium]